MPHACVQAQRMHSSRNDRGLQLITMCQHQLINAANGAHQPALHGGGRGGVTWEFPVLSAQLPINLKVNSMNHILTNSSAVAAPELPREEAGPGEAPSAHLSASPLRSAPLCASVALRADTVPRETQGGVCPAPTPPSSPHPPPGTRQVRRARWRCGTFQVGGNGCHIPGKGPGCSGAFGTWTLRSLHGCPVGRWCPACRGPRGKEACLSRGFLERGFTPGLRPCAVGISEGKGVPSAWLRDLGPLGL